MRRKAPGFFCPSPEPDPLLQSASARRLPRGERNTGSPTKDSGSPDGKAGSRRPDGPLPKAKVRAGRTAPAVPAGSTASGRKKRRRPHCVGGFRAHPALAVEERAGAKNKRCGGCVSSGRPPAVPCRRWGLAVPPLRASGPAPPCGGADSMRRTAPRWGARRCAAQCGGKHAPLCSGGLFRFRGGSTERCAEVWPLADGRRNAPRTGVPVGPSRSV